MTGFAEVLAGDKPVSEEDRREYARRIQEAAGELRALVDEVLGD